MHVFLVCVLFVTTSVAFPEGGSNGEISTETLKDVLRQVFRIPDKAPSTNHRPSGRYLRFMMQLYKKMSAGESQFPKGANTIGSVVPIEDNENRHSLLFNLTTSQDERIISSYLHIMGHRRPAHPSRIAFYLTPADLERRASYTKEFSKEPLMVVLVNKQPLDIDVTRMVKKALEQKPPLLIRIKEEQLRRGSWTASPSKRLLKKSPILILVSSDPDVLDLEAFGVGALRLGKPQRPKDNASLKPPKKSSVNEQGSIGRRGSMEEGLRSKRSLAGGQFSFEFDGNEFQPLEGERNYVTETDIRPHGKSSKDTYWIQKEASKATKPKEDRFSLNNRPFSKDDYYREEFSPLLTNSFASRVDPYKVKAKLKIQNLTKQYEDRHGRGSHSPEGDTEGEWRQSYDVSTEKANPHSHSVTTSTLTPDAALPTESGPKSKMETLGSREIIIDEEDDDSHLLLLPLKDYKPWPKSAKKKTNKKNKKNEDLIPYPEYYASWDNWDYQDSPKWKRKNRKNRKSKNNRDKEKRAKGIPDKWISAGMQNRLSNVASVSPSSPAYSGNCQKHSFYVDFKKLGWADKLIIAPSGFETYFCSGGCPTPLSMTEAGTNHAIIQSLLRASNASPDLPNPCCVPAKLDSLTILILEEDDRVVLRTLPSMVVKSCSCQ